MHPDTHRWTPTTLSVVLAATVWLGCSEPLPDPPALEADATATTAGALRATAWWSALPSPRWRATAGAVAIAVHEQRGAVGSTAVAATLRRDGRLHTQRLSRRIADDVAPAVAAAPDGRHVAVVWTDLLAEPATARGAIYRVDPDGPALVEPSRLWLRTRGRTTGAPAVVWPPGTHLLVTWPAHKGSSAQVQASWCTPQGPCSAPLTVATAAAVHRIVATATDDGTVVLSWLAPRRDGPGVALWAGRLAPGAPPAAPTPIAPTTRCRNLPRPIGLLDAGGGHTVLHWACQTRPDTLLEHHAALLDPTLDPIAEHHLPTDLHTLSALAATAHTPGPSLDPFRP